jgi:hypothetical protein
MFDLTQCKSAVMQTHLMLLGAPREMNDCFRIHALPVGPCPKAIWFRQIFRDLKWDVPHS